MNPSPALTILNRISILLPLGTDNQTPLFIQRGGQVWVQQKYAMSQGSFPACHLESGAQAHARNSQRTHIAQLQVIVSMYDRWDQQPQTMDDLRKNLDSDIELAMATLQANENLAYGGQALATSIPHYAISPYKGEVDEQFVGMNLVFRTLTATVNILPYDY